MIHVCLTHDIDRIDKTYQYFTKPLRALRKGNFFLFFKLIKSAVTIRNPYWGFDEIMRIEEKYKVKSTCFILNESIKFQFKKPKTWKLSLGRYNIHDRRIVKIIKLLDSNGWEIGVHGSYNSYNNFDLLKREKDTLESILGHEVFGIRQHYLNFSNNTFTLHNQVGYKYDSTWGYKNHIGFKEGKIKPFFPIANSYYCEIPLVIMDSPFANTQEKWKLFKEITEEVDRNNAYLVINYHNNNFSNSDFLEYNTDYIQMIKYLKRRNSHFMTMKEAYQEILISNN